MHILSYDKWISVFLWILTAVSYVVIVIADGHTTSSAFQQKYSYSISASKRKAGQAYPNKTNFNFKGLLYHPSIFLFFSESWVSFETHSFPIQQQFLRTIRHKGKRRILLLSSRPQGIEPFAAPFLPTWFTMASEISYESKVPWLPEVDCGRSEFVQEALKNRCHT
jgi:hypothetical protein